MTSTNPSERAVLLVHGYIRECSKALLKDKSVPDDVMNMCWKSFFIPFASAIIKKGNDLDIFFDLLSEKISNERMENAKLLYQESRDASWDAKFPYDKLTDKGPYLFIIESTDGYVFGGYCTLNILEERKGTYLSDENAFVWILKGEKVQKPTIYSIKAGGKDAVYYNTASYWWIFGPSGADIVLYRGLARDHYCCVNNASGSQLKYDIPKERTLLGSYSRHVFQMFELEIFSVPN